ncbi:sulfurtransferase [Allostella vacuolata]|nr:sulfurtransferase [Stella vacuolata]
MASNSEISPSQLARLVGLPGQPVIVDVRTDDDFASDPRIVPGTIRRDFRTVPDWAGDFTGSSVVVVCQRGAKLSQGVSAWLRHDGITAESLEGGFEGWRRAQGLLVDTAKIPGRDGTGRTVWVTRARPKIDRIACPWLIRRFVDAAAVFLFVSASEVVGVAERFGATPFDIEGAFWSHRGERCTFDTMIEEFGLHSGPLDRLADIVRAADTARLDAAPQAAGLLAASLGYSRMYRDDQEQLAASLSLYDAFYRWCRDAVDETHDWPAPRKPA